LKILQKKQRGIKENLLSGVLFYVPTKITVGQKILYRFFKLSRQNLLMQPVAQRPPCGSLITGQFNEIVRPGSNSPGLTKSRFAGITGGG